MYKMLNLAIWSNESDIDQLSFHEIGNIMSGVGYLRRIMFVPGEAELVS